MSKERDKESLESRKKWHHIKKKKNYSIRLATDLSTGALKEMLKYRKVNIANPQE